MGGGVKLSTPIDLKTIENEVASLSGRASATPISMESLWNEVQNLKKNLDKTVTLKSINISCSSNYGSERVTKIDIGKELSKNSIICFSLRSEQDSNHGTNKIDFLDNTKQSVSFPSYGTSNSVTMQTRIYKDDTSLYIASKNSAGNQYKTNVSGNIFIID